MIITHKRCTKCNTKKLLSEFTRQKTVKDGRSARCKACACISNTLYYARNKEQILIRHRAKKYGFSVKQLQTMLARQNNNCAICGLPEAQRLNGVLPALCVDHDRETGKVRGLLCVRCNSMIGQANYDPYRLKMAIRYLKKASFLS